MKFALFTSRPHDGDSRMAKTLEKTVLKVVKLRVKLPTFERTFEFDETTSYTQNCTRMTFTVFVSFSCGLNKLAKNDK